MRFKFLAWFLYLLVCKFFVVVLWCKFKNKIFFLQNWVNEVWKINTYVYKKKPYELYKKLIV